MPHELGLEAMNYWIDLKREIIPERFTKEFILEVITFILENNNFKFDGKMWHQKNESGMGIDFVGP